MSNMWIYVISRICAVVQLVDQPAVLHRQNFHTDQYSQTFQPVFHSKNPYTTIALHHFVPLQVALTLLEGHKVREKWSMLYMIFLLTSQLVRMSAMWCYLSSYGISSYQFRVRIT